MHLKENPEEMHALLRSQPQLCYALLQVRHFDGAVHAFTVLTDHAQDGAY